ncbi:MAG: hypothetical protein KKF44_07405 [Nanoarchaeota archaeon]|nr:hypothetical protein [Nanoarchaeota archaeon]
MESIDLKSWLQHYLKYKDSIEQRIKEIKDIDQGVEVIYDDCSTKFLIVSGLKDENIELLRTHETVCTLNSQSNFDFLIRNWNTLAKLPKLTFIFVNLKLGEKWFLKPHIHNSIADKDGLEQGLRTMFEAANGRIKEVKPAKQKMFEDSEENDDINT